MTTSKLTSWVAKIRRWFRYELVRPADDGYETARRIWNGVIDRRPALIAPYADATDVVAAVRLASERGLEVAVQSCGRGVNNNAARTGDAGGDEHVAWCRGAARGAQAARPSKPVNASW
jgi:FAD/FMN-containing dehydrogenase